MSQAVVADTASEGAAREHGERSPGNGKAEENDIFNSFALSVLCLKKKKSLLHLTFVAICLFILNHRTRLCVLRRGRGMTSEMSELL